MIYIIGDSHFTFITKNSSIPMYPEEHDDVEGYKTFRIGGTAHASPRLLSVVKEIFKKENIHKDDIVLHTYGEIDIRYYATKLLFETTHNPYYMLKNVIEEYSKFLLQVKMIHKKLGVFLMWPQNYDNMPKIFGWCNRKERNALTKYYNSLLIKKCNELDIFYIDFWKIIPQNPEGVPPSDWFLPDGIHFNNLVREPFEKELNKVLGIL